ncbi:MAG TPA: hypothetical protein PLA69_05715, partial [Flavobacterium sp.]|nr:hypothetical protein [Flavobacterium sp.]
GEGSPSRITGAQAPGFRADFTDNLLEVAACQKRLKGAKRHTLAVAKQPQTSPEQREGDFIC